jgi:Domain of unknown function (DUF4192)
VAGFLYARMLFGPSNKRSAKVTTNAIKLTSPHELLAVVPYLLGFNPTNSIMVVCLRDHRLGLAQRLDLPQDTHDVASALLPSLMTENPDAVILIGFEDNEGESLPALEALTTALQSSAMRIHDRIVVRDGRWWSLDCHNPNCCPAEGSSVPEPADVSGVVAEFVGRGVAPHLDRESLARQVEAGLQAAAVATAIRSGEKVVDCPAFPRAELFAARPRILDPEALAITVEDAARAALSLLDIEIRDGLVAWLCPGTLGLDELSQDIQKLFCGLEKTWDTPRHLPLIDRASERHSGPSDRPLRHASRPRRSPGLVGPGFLCLVAWGRRAGPGCPGPSTPLRA